MENGLTVLKVGGSLLENDEYIKKLARFTSKIKGHKIIVHGGGSKTTEVSKMMGITPKMIDGRRVTDADTLDAATMVYAGLYNKKVVSIFQKYRSEEHTSELQSRGHLVCRLLLEKKK